MNLEFFGFLVFMSLSSFALAFLEYVLITKMLGKEGKASRWAQILLIPTIIVAFDMIVFTAPADYQYFIGALPMAGVVGLVLYSIFYKGNRNTEVVPEKPAPVRNEEKKLSKKSARIHAARAKRGRD